MNFALALAIAASWWGSHGVTIPCHPQAQSVSYAWMAEHSELGAASAAGNTTNFPDCTIYMSPTITKLRKADPALYCASIVHEFGNLAGIPETDNRGLVTDRQLLHSEIWDCQHPRYWRKQHWGY